MGKTWKLFFFFGRKSWEIDLVFLSSFLNELRVIFWSWFLFFFKNPGNNKSRSFPLLSPLFHGITTFLFLFYLISFLSSLFNKEQFLSISKSSSWPPHGKPQCVWKERNSRNNRDAIAMSSIGERMLHWLLEVPSSIARTISRKKNKEK